MLLLTSLLLATPAIPINKAGSSCPFGYYSQSSYCVPSAALKTPVQAIPRSSNTCPYGTYSAGNYCTWRPN